MAMMKRSGIVVIGLAATTCIAWLSWAWSPALDEHAPIANHAGDTAPVPISQALTQPQPEHVAQAVAAPEPKAPEPKSEPPPAAPDASLLQQPERIPTPHPMSLDQTKPPEQFGALTELKNQYASESRSAESSATESKLRALISTPNIPSELVQGISCRRNLCKIDTQWTPHRRLGFAVLLESFKQLYSQRVAVEPAPARSDDGTYLTTLYVRINP
jgi:type IV secretory pathway VirB10-like protein